MDRKRKGIAVQQETLASPDVPSEIALGSYTFSLVESLVLEHDETGVIAERRPQAQYYKADLVPLHKHGEGPFCKFGISVPLGLVGVYALLVDGQVRYIGESEDLRKRFSYGYGNISPRNCYKGGQGTNLKINRRVLEVAKAAGRVDLYFYGTNARKQVERQLLDIYSPAWNDK